MSENTKTAPKKENEFSKELIRLAGVLFIITSVVAVLLGFVNNTTAPIIEQIAITKRNETMEEFFPECDFTPLEDDIASVNNLKAAFVAYKNDEIQGVIAEVGPAGYGGEINLIVAIDAQGAVIGASITKMSETAGLGSKAKDAGFLEQYAGQTGPFTVVKTGTGAEGEIQAISSATITTNAVTNGVRTALSFAEWYLGGVVK